MQVFDFDHAIVREPGRSVVQGLRSDPRGEPTYDGVLSEHRAYVAALRDAGLAVEILPPLEAFPDSVFVEDPAFLIPEGAILLRPGAPSRLAEREHMCETLIRHFGQVLELGEGEDVDGGDVLITPAAIFIGLSKRTNKPGAEALRAHLRTLSRETRIVQTPPEFLHLKTVSSLLDEETLLVTRAMAASGIFAGFRLLIAPDGEEAAANALRVNDTVMIGDCYPRTLDLVARHGVRVTALPVTEIAKLDAGLSCMSLRWRKLP